MLIRRLSVLVILVLALVVVACGSSDIVATTAPQVLDQGDEVVEDPLPVASEPEPTNTPEPTSTPEPTNTPKPTPTITPLPEPVVYEGSGDSIVDVDKPTDAMITRITGNSCSRHFAVISLDENNESIDLLVNTSDSYEGVVPIDFHDDEWTRRFEISSNCEWLISLEPLLLASIYEAPGVITGTGDDVVIMILGEGEKADLAHIVGNAADRHFAVISYSDEGYSDLEVNTSDPYDGTVILDTDTFMFVVKAVGDWSIEVTTK